MNHSDALDQVAKPAEKHKPVQKRRIVNAIWQPFLQFKLLMYMLGSTALVALMLGGFLYFAFSDLMNVVTGRTDATSYYGDMIQVQLVHLFRYCAVLFVLYILLLASVCVAYTHRLIGPLRPFLRHIDKLTAGDYSSRVSLRKGDLDMYAEFANKLNNLAIQLNTKQTSGNSDYALDNKSKSG